MFSSGKCLGYSDMYSNQGVNLILPHGMLHGLSTDQVEMQVVNFLLAMRASVEDQAVAVFGDALLLSNFSHSIKHTAGNRFVFWLKIIVIRDVFVGHNQDMDGRDRIYITESGDLLVLVYLRAGDLPGDNFTK